MTQQEIEVFLTVARLSTYLLPPVFREFLALPGPRLPQLPLPGSL